MVFELAKSRKTYDWQAKLKKSSLTTEFCCLSSWFIMVILNKYQSEHDLRSRMSRWCGSCSEGLSRFVLLNNGKFIVYHCFPLLSRKKSSFDQESSPDPCDDGTQRSDYPMSYWIKPIGEQVFIRSSKYVPFRIWRFILNKCCFTVF